MTSSRNLLVYIMSIITTQQVYTYTTTHHIPYQLFLKYAQNVRMRGKKKRRPLKILVVDSFFPAFSSTAILNQIIGLLDRGHEVYIYAKRQGNLDWTNPKIHAYNLFDRVYYNQIPPDIHTYDIIYCQFGYRGIEFLKHKNKIKFNAKLVTCFRGADITKQVAEDPHRYDELFKTGDLFLPVCNYFKKLLIQLGCDPHKILVHRSTVDCNKFSYKPRILHPNETINIITVCRLIEKKGLDYGIHAINILRKKYPNIRYTIVGFGPLKEHLEQLIMQLGAQNFIKLSGRASEDEVSQFLDQSHIFIHPSITSENGDQEGIPNALKEAMARGLAVVGTRHAGIPELITQGVTGFLVPERSIKQLVEKIEYLILHPEIWKSMGLEAYKKIKAEYDIDVLNERIIRIFRSLIHKKTAPPLNL